MRVRGSLNIILSKLFTVQPHTVLRSSHPNFLPLLPALPVIRRVAGSLGGEHETDALFVNGEKHPSLTAEFGCQDFAVKSAPMTTVTPADASTPIEEDLAGKVAVIDRGVCALNAKAKAAQDKGAIAVIIVNCEVSERSKGEMFTIPHFEGSEEISIYVCCVSKSTGDALKALGQDGLATFTRRTYLEKCDRPS